ncbi:hypothetical protein CSB37_00300 [bacterium DOLZORAL124_38_8]|nr:MAG: hypothetical protein CSB37_00300 [bacterium DOLZORAL124_38_8]
MKYETLKHYCQQNPLTSGLISLNILIFVLNRIPILPVIVSQPRVLNFNSFLANFSHYDLLHLLFNLLVLVQISPLLERKFTAKTYGLIVLFITILTTIGVSQLSPYPTLGFSGIALGLMVLTGLLFWKQNPIISKQMLGWAGANIVLGLMPGVSFVGHLIGAFAGMVVFGILFLFKKRFPNQE